jgi:methionine--tRNA ligase beta chain
MVSFDEWQRLDIRVGEVKRAEPVPETDRLLKLTVNIGEEERTMVAGIAREYPPKQLVGRKLLVLANLEPKVLRGIESKGMILAAMDKGRPVVVGPEKDVPAGSKIM